MELIKISERNGQKVVSAVELHSTLQVETPFTKWIKRMFKYGHEENIDWTKLSVGNQPIDYALTLDCAKHISMIQRSEIGMKIRNYFIECERVSQNPLPKIPTPKEIAFLLIKSEEEKERLQIVNELQAKELIQAAPLVSYAKEVLTSESTYNTNLIAKELGMSAISLNQILHSKGIQYKQGETWVLYFKYQHLGYTKTKTSTYTSANGETKTSMLTVWTELGRKFIHELMKQNLSVA